MMTHFLKFTDESDAITAMPGFHSADGWLTGSHTHALDAVGTVLSPTGVILKDADGMSYPEMSPMPGFHLNFAGDLPAELAPFKIFPNSPSRVFA